MATDGMEFSLFDKKLDEIRHCDFNKLNDQFDFFLPLAGIERYTGSEENPADIKAVQRLAKLQDEILRVNPDWADTEKKHVLNQFIMRTLFCLFAEDTGGFEKDLFVKTITEYGGEDGEHTQALLRKMYRIMSQPMAERGKVPTCLQAFPWVNGGLFAEDSEVPSFSRRARQQLLDAAKLSWRDISPDIFGSMMQSLADPDKRDELGLHYTSVPNIMKVLRPLFLLSLKKTTPPHRVISKNTHGWSNSLTASITSVYSTRPVAQGISSSSPTGNCVNWKFASSNGNAL